MDEGRWKLKGKTPERRNRDRADARREWNCVSKWSADRSAEDERLAKRAKQGADVDQGRRQVGAGRRLVTED